MNSFFSFLSLSLVFSSLCGWIAYSIIREQQTQTQNSLLDYFRLISIIIIITMDYFFFFFFTPSSLFLLFIASMVMMINTYTHAYTHWQKKKFYFNSKLIRCKFDNDVDDDDDRFGNIKSTMTTTTTTIATVKWSF